MTDEIIGVVSTLAGEILGFLVVLWWQRRSFKKRMAQWNKERSNYAKRWDENR